MGPKWKPSDEGRRDHDAYERETAWANGLRARYGDVVQEPLPDRFSELLEQLDNAESRRR